MWRTGLVGLLVLAIVGCSGQKTEDSTEGLTTKKLAAIASYVPPPSGSGPLVVGDVEQSSVFLAANPNDFNFVGTFGLGDGIAAGDLDHDGVPEIVRGRNAQSIPGAIEIYNQTGQLLSLSALHLGALPGFLTGNLLAVGDINGDGFGDIVVAQQGQGQTAGGIFVVMGNGAPSITSVTGQMQFFGGDGMVVCDVDHDGFDDIIIAPSFQKYSGGTGKISQFVTANGKIPSFVAGVSKLACGDVNNDGFADLIIATAGTANYQVLTDPSLPLITSFFPNTEPVFGTLDEIAAGDLDGDGFAEVVIGHIQVAPPGNSTGPEPGNITVLSAPGKTPPFPSSFNNLGEFFVGDKLAIPHVTPFVPAPTVVTSTVPYVLQFIMYEPPGDKSSVSYGTSNAIGSNTTWSTTTKLGESGSLTGIFGSPFGVGLSVTTSNTTGGGASFQTTTGETLTMSVAAGSADVPDHKQDQFWLTFGGVATSTDKNNGQPPTVSIDMSNAVLNRLTGGQLQGITQGDLSGITDPTLLGLVNLYVKPSDAAQLLAVDPFFSGEDLTQNPGRYAPGTPATAQFFGPSVKGENPDVVGITESVANGGSSTTGESTDFTLTVSATVPMAGGVTATYGISYSNTTTTTNTTTTSAGLSFGSDNVCVQGNVNIYLDMAFGTFLTIPQLSNPCLQQPLETMSFESLSDWQVQGGGSAVLSGQAANGAEAFSIAANGWTPIVSKPLSSALLRGAAKSSNLSTVSFALDIPTAQPNQYWIGAAQMYISAPSANVYSAYMGQVELTGLPQGRFDRLGFTIPGYALHAVTEDHPDVSFTIVLNVNPGTSGWLLDDLEIGN